MRMRLRLGLIGMALALAVTGWTVGAQVYRAALGDTALRGDATLQLAVTSLGGQLQRFERLPALIAGQPLIRSLAEAPSDAGLVAEANAYLAMIQEMLGASDVYLMDEKGITLAASNHASETSFVGGNFAFRPYFTDAITGGTGRFFALGTTSGRRGYYFGAPVMGQAGIAGVLVFKIDLDAVETAWRGNGDALFVTDPEGIVFLSGRAEWLFRALDPLTPDAEARLAKTRRYAGTQVRQMDVLDRGVIAGQDTLLLPYPGGARRYLMRTTAMPEAGWTLRILLDTSPALRQAMVTGAAAALALGALLMAGAVLAQRRARLAERMQMQAAAQAGLEARVVARTQELAGLNTRLEAEVAERRLAEAHLRRAQDDLVQAGKLAALGQMSAALSHEFNQPLAAARAYADNTAVLLDRGRVDEARGNLTRILRMIDRMAALSRHLHSFARKPGAKLGPVHLSDVMESVVEIVTPRLRAAGAVLTVEITPGLPAVIAGPVRLSQVLVNLITNAADAVEDRTDRRIEVAADVAAAGLVLTVRDYGPGVPQAIEGRIFDPFFSTKGVGKGLGLGLSISYNIVKDFGGDLAVQGAPGGGALFRLTLRRADVAEAAA